MTTLDDVLQQQQTDGILQAPTVPSSSSTTQTVEFAAATNSTMNISLVNNTSSSTVYAYITGLAINNSDAVYLLQSDGETVYYPTSPSSTGASLAQDVAIALGAPGNTVTVTIPQTAGGRIWFSRDATLNFYLNPGPGLVEPSVTNESDTNYNIFWDFCEFTFNSAELFVNISYVDFVSLPIGLQLENTSGTITTVEGLPSGGLDTVCSGLTTQTAVDGSNWSDLIVKTSTGANLRALSPNSGITMNSSYFSTYFDAYVAQVWSKYTGATLTVDTQASWGDVTGTVSGSVLDFGSAGTFAQPTSANIFSCSSGPFAYTTDEMANIGARLAAAFNRSTLLVDTNQPEGEVVSTYYTNSVTNHYARLLHATYLDGKGYAFPYDDVAPTGGADQSGSLYDPNPQLLTVTVGGPSASSSTVRLRDMATRQGQRVAGRRQGPHQRVRRDVLQGWMSAEDEKRMLADKDNNNNKNNDSEVDLEKGLDRGKQENDLFFTTTKGVENGSGGQLEKETMSSSSALFMHRSLNSLVPHAWATKVTTLLGRLEASSPAYTKAKPVIELVVRLVTLFLSMSIRALISRVTMALFLVLFYFVMPMISTRGGGGGDGQVRPMNDVGMGLITADDDGVGNIMSTLAVQQ